MTPDIPGLIVALASEIKVWASIAIAAGLTIWFTAACERAPYDPYADPSRLDELDRRKP